jgi:hypothetical protein
VRDAAGPEHFSRIGHAGDNHPVAGNKPHIRGRNHKVFSGDTLSKNTLPKQQMSFSRGHHPFLLVMQRSSGLRLIMYFMEIEGDQDKPFQPFIKMYRHTAVVIPKYGSSDILNHQTTVRPLENNFDSTFLSSIGAATHFHEQAGYTDIP